MKTGASLWPPMLASKGAVQVLKVVSGNGAILDIGKVMQTTVEKAEANAFKIMLKGEAFVVRGLPLSMLGRKINILAQHSGAGVELAWFATPATSGKDPSAQHKPPAADSRPSETIATGKAAEGLNVLAGKKAGAQGMSSAGQSERRGAIQALQSGTGEIIIAWVQKRLRNGNILFKAGGASFESPAPPSIRHGDALMLRLTKDGKPEVLQVHSGIEQKALSILRDNLTATVSGVQGVAAMHRLLSAMATSDWPESNVLPLLEAWLNDAGSNNEKPINGRQLAALLHDSGQNLEHKLLTALHQGKPDMPLQHDLKAILLRIAALQADHLQPDKLQHAALMRTLADMAGQSASHIEAGQALNLLADMQGDAHRFEFPMLVNQQVINVQMSMQQNSRGAQQEAGEDQAENKEYNVLFTLELSQLGGLRIDANISANAVYARIHHDSVKSQQFIQQNMQRLESRLHDLGYAEVYLIASAAPPDAEKQARFDRLTIMTPVSSSLLDICA